MTAPALSRSMCWWSVSRISAAERKRRSGSYSTARIRIHSISFEMAGLIWRGVGFFEKSKMRSGLSCGSEPVIRWNIVAPKE